MSEPDGFTWIERPLLAGLPRPSSLDELQWLRHEGIQILLALTEDRPRRDWTEEAGLLVVHEPVEDMEPPTQQQLDRCVSALTKGIERGMGVAVHCGAGLGRTGTVLAAYLVSRGQTASAAIARVRKLRPGSVETREQEEAVELFARRRRQGA